MAVSLSALRTGRLYPQDMLVVLISVRDWVDPRAIVRSEGILYQWKIPMTPAAIEPATFRFVAHHLNHCATTVPTLTVRGWILLYRISGWYFLCWGSNRNFGVFLQNIPSYGRCHLQWSVTILISGRVLLCVHCVIHFVTVRLYLQQMKAETNEARKIIKQASVKFVFSQNWISAFHFFSLCLIHSRVWWKEKDGESGSVVTWKIWAWNKKEKFADKIHQLEQGSDIDSPRFSLHSKYQIS